LLTPFAARAVIIPDGTSLFVRTVDQVSSSDKAGKSFAARLDSNLVVKGKVVIPAGSKVYGRVESSRSSIDVLVFTGGIGENNPLIRAQVLRHEPAGFQCFLPPAPGEINVCPASKPIFLVPGALAMP
jgi:hypothetical protein